MALTAANVRVAVTGGFYFGPDGTTLPTAADSSLNVAFKELGYVSEDGVTQSIDSDTEIIKAWQNGDTVRKLMTSHDLTYALSLLETNTDTLKAYYGNNTVTSGAGTTEIKAESGARGEWVLDVVDGDQLIRVVIPDGEVTERGDVEYVNGGAIMYPITITTYPDDSGVKAYLYTDTAA